MCSAMAMISAPGRFRLRLPGADSQISVATRMSSSGMSVRKALRRSIGCTWLATKICSAASSAFPHPVVAVADIESDGDDVAPIVFGNERVVVQDPDDPQGRSLS